MRARQLSVRRQVGKGEHRCKYIRQEFLQLQSFLIKVVEWRQNPARPWGQAGSIDYVYLKKKKSFKAKLGKSCHWHARLTSQGAAALAGPKDEDQVLWWPGWQASETAGSQDTRTSVSSPKHISVKRGAQVTKQCTVSRWTPYISDRECGQVSAWIWTIQQDMRKITPSLIALQ